MENRVEELVQVVKDYIFPLAEPKDYDNICGFCDDILEEHIKAVESYQETKGKIKHCSEDNLSKRATPRKPIKHIIVDCPVCGNSLCHDDEELRENFCPVCGQAIKWGGFDINDTSNN